jgi:hypothetical protein
MTTAPILELRYSTTSEVASTGTTSRIRIALEAKRKTVGVRGKIRDAELLRDAFLACAAIKESDLRYKGKDRTAYLAYLMKKGKKATAAIWAAQKSFLEGAYADEAPKPRGLDPVLTVDPDEVSLEVFSRDESAYARLAFANELFEDREAAHGTTLADLSPALIEQIERVRTYQPTYLEAGTELKGTALDRHVELPAPWLRGFLQVQSAASLPGSICELAPVDLYNVLFVLRMRKAKKAPRALRFELVPGARPRIVIEPWEYVLESHGPVFSGKTPRVVRIYGRQRLLSLARALPHVRHVKVHLLGAGLPSFWTLDMGLARMTMAMTSWSESSWAGATSFDALMPKEDDKAVVDKVVKTLQEKGPQSLAELGGQSARSALQRASLQGRVLFDLDRQKYRPRQLMADPVDEKAIRYGSPREALAHRLLDQGDAKIKITKIHVVHGEGTEIWGEIEDQGARRTFAPRFTIDIEGQVREAWCNCPTYMRSALREGPCEHMLALRVFHVRKIAEAERLRLTPEGRKHISAETRTFIRRDHTGSQTTYRVSLDDRVVRIEWIDVTPGITPGEPRRQRMWFDTDSEARNAYFARLDQLAEKGFIDEGAASA